MSKQLTQLEFVKEWFREREGRFIHHSESKPALEQEWLDLTGKRFEDPDRAIRRLFQQNVLVQSDVEKGLYAWNSDAVESAPEVFSSFMKEAIRARDGYSCVECDETNELDKLHVVFIVTPAAGGKAVPSNGKTLCGYHALLLELSRNRKLAKQVMAKVLAGLYDEDGSLQVEVSHLQRLLSALSSDGHQDVSSLESLLK